MALHITVRALSLVLAISLLASCNSAPSSPTAIRVAHSQPPDRALPATSTSSAAPVTPDPTAGPSPTGAALPASRISRLDLYPEEHDDLLARMPAPALDRRHGSVLEIVKELAARSDIPFQLYSEGLEHQRVTIDSAAAGSMRDLVASLCLQADGYAAYYVNTIDQNITGGIKLTRRPWRDYSPGARGALLVIHP